MTQLINLSDLTAQRLKNIAYSAEIDLDGATKKDEIIETLQDENVELTADGWMRDGEEFELKERTTKPSDTGVLYGFRRKGCTEERIEEIQELFEETQYEMRLLEKTETDKEPFKVVIPAEED